MNIYVGNLSRDVSEQELRETFEAFGEVKSANIIKDKFTGQSKGFGFVEMADKDAALAAISQLNGVDLKGRTINVNEARPKPEGGRRFGGSTGGGSRGGFGSGPRRSGNGGGFGGRSRGNF